MGKAEIIRNIKQEVKKADKPENRLDYQRFFKEKLKERYRIKTPVLRKISNKCFRDVKDLPKKEIFDICEELLKSDFMYGRFFAFEWAAKLKKDYARSDFSRLERWLKDYVDNWAACDHLCCGAMGHLVMQFPELSSRVKKWAKSESIWMRRASAVSLIVALHNNLLLDDVFRTADVLLTDEEDMVQKGYGWMLKEASNMFPDEVFAYVMKHKDSMSRTALRYAIEKYPPGKRKEAMK